MYTISKTKASVHFYILKKRLDQLKRDFDLLSQWIEKEGFEMGERLLNLTQDSLEALNSDLKDFDSFFKEPESPPSKGKKIVLPPRVR